MGTRIPRRGLSLSVGDKIFLRYCSLVSDISSVENDDDVADLLTRAQALRNTIKANTEVDCFWQEFAKELKPQEPYKTLLDTLVAFLFLESVFAQFLREQLCLLHSNFVLEQQSKDKLIEFPIPYLQFWRQRPRFPFGGANGNSSAYKVLLKLLCQPGSEYFPPSVLFPENLLDVVKGWPDPPSDLGIDVGTIRRLIGLERATEAKSTNIYDQDLDDVKRHLQDSFGYFELIDSSLGPPIAEILPVMMFDYLLNVLGALLPPRWEPQYAQSKIMGTVAIEHLVECVKYLEKKIDANKHEKRLEAYIQLLAPLRSNEVHVKLHGKDSLVQCPYSPPVQALFTVLYRIRVGLAAERRDTTPRLEIRFPIVVAGISEPTAWFYAAVQVDNVDHECVHKLKILVNQVASILVHDSNYQPTPQQEKGCPIEGPGRLRPLVYVLDDYNNYVWRTESEKFERNDRVDLPSWYNERQPSLIKDQITQYCAILNDLNGAFEVRSPKVWLDLNDAPNEEAVAYGLPFEQFDADRPSIAAFLVELDWMPTIRTNVRERRKEREIMKSWLEYLGARIIRLLSLRYPEIACFAFSHARGGPSQMRGLREGASWFFVKSKGPPPRGLDPLGPGPLLQKLREAAGVRYGSFSTAPFPGQLVMDPEDATASELAKRLGVQLPIGRCVRGKSLCQLIARVFVGIEEVRPVKVLSSGKSTAQATFFVSTRTRSKLLASRFVKVGPWSSILKEFLAFNRVIRPRLGSYVAQVIDNPVFGGGGGAEGEWGAISYSTVGLPERHEDLKSLNDQLKMNQKPGEGKRIAERLINTLKRLLPPLHGGGSTAGKPVPVNRPLSGWLGWILPPLFSGRVDESGNEWDDLGCHAAKGYKVDTAWLLASSDLIRKREDKSSFLDNGGPVKLQGFPVYDVQWDALEDEGKITLLHPDLGFRIQIADEGARIRSCVELASHVELASRDEGVVSRGLENAPWMRPGMPVTVSVQLESPSESDRLKSERKTLNLAAQSLAEILRNPEMGDTTALLNAFWKCQGKVRKTPLEWWKHLPLHHTINAREGAIHGDLNLNNILFSDDSAEGWLIDFELAQENGMVAFDFAKLEVEVWIHHVFSSLRRLWDGFEHGPPCGLDSLRWALLAADAATFAGDVFAQQWSAAMGGGTDEVPSLLSGVVNLLDVVGALRGHALTEVSENELYWALAVAFLASLKHLGAKVEAALAYVACDWYLEKVVPKDLEELDTIAGRGGVKCLTRNAQDGLIQRISIAPTGAKLDEFVKLLAGSQERPNWGDDDYQVWDFASTGSVGNVTPILGFLWLLARAETERENGRSFYVPKISSRGSSCGTIDILESGRVWFASTPERILEECKRHRGVLCRSERIAPDDAAIMERRKKINAMKNAALVYTSILAKKAAVGCTHGVVDVKLGKDTKMLLSPWSGDREASDLRNPRRSDGGMSLWLDAEPLQALLLEMGIETTMTNGKWGQYLEQNNGPLTLKCVRWFLTDASQPQCRAIGRHLILYYLNDQLQKAKLKFGDFSSGPLASLYKGLGEIVGLADAEPELVAKQWQELCKRFKGLGETLVELKKVIENALKEKKGEVEDRHDLNVRTLYMSDMGFQSSRKIARIDAYALDEMFEWLCGDNPYDTEVGLYLHKLQGEKVRLKKKINDPLVSVFFRPSRTPEVKVTPRLRRLLSQAFEFVDARRKPVEPR